MLLLDHGARLAAVCRADDTVVFKLLNQAGSPVKANFKAPLHQRYGCAPLLAHKSLYFAIQGVLRRIASNQTAGIPVGATKPMRTGLRKPLSHFISPS